MLKFRKNKNRAKTSNNTQAIIIKKEVCFLFSKFYISCQIRNGDMKLFFLQKNQSYKEFRCTDTIIVLPDTVIPGNLPSMWGANRVALFPLLLTECTNTEPDLDQLIKRISAATGQS